MNQTQIEEVTSHKHLGVLYSNDCTWDEHLDYIKSKAWIRVNIMRKLKFKLDRHSLQTICFSFIRPVTEYSDVVWDNYTLYEANELEKIQIEADRIVTGATKLVSIDSLYIETGWDTLASRRKKHVTETSPCAIGNFRKWLFYKCFMSLSLIVVQTNIKFLKITVTWTNIW